MRADSVGHLSDRDLLRDLAALVAQDRNITAKLLAHLAEVDARKLYVPAGYPSMFVYCVEELRLSEDAAYKRIQVARMARRFPAILEALAAGRLHMTAVIVLSPYLTSENAAELLAAAARKTKPEIEQWLAQRFPRPDVPARLEAITASGELAPERVDALAPTAELVPERVDALAPTTELAPERVDALALTTELAPERVDPAAWPKVKPLSSQRFALQVTIGQSTHDKLRYARELLSHRIPSGDLAQVLDAALDALVGKLEKQKFAATERPRASRRPSMSKRRVPAHVKRAVWRRDRGRCTFVGDNGHRCGARKFLEFDHVDPVARGGEATVGGMRLRCRAHNQYEAERTFGAGFMSGKREVARAPARERAQELDRDVKAALRTLGFRADEASRAAAFSESTGEASLEQRVRLALFYLRPRARTHAPPMVGVCGTA